jgi:hypothetical protein
MTEPVWTEAERLPNATPQTEPSHDGIEVRQLHSVMFDSLVVTGNTAASGGTCTVNKVPCTFIVQVQDNGEPGTNDAFVISVNFASAEGGTLRSGNIQIHD